MFARVYTYFLAVIIHEVGLFGFLFTAQLGHHRWFQLLVSFNPWSFTILAISFVF